MTSVGLVRQGQILGICAARMGARADKIQAETPGIRHPLDAVEVVQSLD